MAAMALRLAAAAGSRAAQAVCERAGG